MCVLLLGKYHTLCNSTFGRNDFNFNEENGDNKRDTSAFICYVVFLKWFFHPYLFIVDL